jgi:hypothetical protein
MRAVLRIPTLRPVSNTKARHPIYPYLRTSRGRALRPGPTTAEQLKPSLGIDDGPILANEVRPSGNDILQLLVGLRNDAGEDMVSDIIGRLEYPDQRPSTDTPRRWFCGKSVLMSDPRSATHVI